MTRYIAALLIALAASPALAFDGPYFQGIWEGDNYKHPAVSAGTLLTTKGAFDGISTQVTLIWHKSDPENSLIPQMLQNIGVKPFAWSLLNCGGGYGNGEGTLQCGSGVNLAPSLLGPIAQPLKGSSNALAKAVGTYIADDPQGNGLNLGYVWSQKPVQHGTLMPLNAWGSHLDAFLGMTYLF